jgi:hypothetical protein
MFKTGKISSCNKSKNYAFLRKEGMFEIFLMNLQAQLIGANGLESWQKIILLWH